MIHNTVTNRIGCKLFGLRSYICVRKVKRIYLGAEPSGVEQLKDGFVFWLASTNVDFHRFALDSFTIL